MSNYEERRDLLKAIQELNRCLDIEINKNKNSVPIEDVLILTRVIESYIEVNKFLCEPDEDNSVATSDFKEALSKFYSKHYKLVKSL